ncbi:MAG TPA: hypothetical protein VI911_10725 [Patescibacteria group bacterium]|nr:hypothetical protein [Patescibacteria group bacterium]
MIAREDIDWFWGEWDKHQSGGRQTIYRFWDSMETRYPETIKGCWTAMTENLYSPYLQEYECE